MCSYIKYLNSQLTLFAGQKATQSAPQAVLASHPIKFMGFFDAVNHLANFAAPAAFVALCVVWGSRFFKLKKPVVQAFTAQLAINFVACLATLAAGLWFFERDGKMATYLGMVVTSGTVQWVLGRGWKT